MAKEDEQLEELRAIKKLLMLQLLRTGVKQVHIANMLGVSEATISRMLPKGLAKAVGKSASVPTEGGL